MSNTPYDPRSKATLWNVVTGALASAVRERLGAETPQAVLDLELHARGEDRVSVEEVYAMLHDAATVSKDPAFGFRMGSQINLGVFQAVEFAVRSAADGYEALETLARYYRIISNRAALEFERQGARPRLVLRPPLDPEFARIATEILFAVILRRTEAFFDSGVIVEIAFAHSAPRDLSAYQELAPARIRFGAEDSAVFFSAERLAKPLSTADAEVHAFVRGLADDLLRMLPGEMSLEERLRALLRKTEEFPNLEEAARRLGTSTRTLQRRLASVGSSYADEVDEVRRMRAVAMLEESGATCDQVARRLGFLSAGSLTRAFRRWYGTTPTEYVVSKSTPPPPPPTPGPSHGDVVPASS